MDRHRFTVYHLGRIYVHSGKNITVETYDLLKGGVAMDRGKGLLDRLAAQADLPDAVFPGQPLLEVLGDRRV